MSKILKTHPKSVQAHKDLILQCLEDKDESIRLRALDLLYGMVSKKNLMEIVKKLMVHMDKAEGTIYRDELLSKIILICSQNNYQFITNFEWYITVLVELAQMEFGSKQGRYVYLLLVIESHKKETTTSTVFVVLYLIKKIYSKFWLKLKKLHNLLTYKYFYFWQWLFFRIVGFLLRTSLIMFLRNIRFV